jgi:hypothetical protein
MHEQFRMVLVLEEGQLRAGQNTRKTTQTLAGWVARTRPLAEPLSPRGPQPVVTSYWQRAFL